MTARAVSQQPTSHSDELRVAFAPSSLGLVLVAASADGVAAVLIGEDRDALRGTLRGRFPGVPLGDGDARTHALAEHVVRTIESPTVYVPTTVPLDLRGTPFQRRVWEALRAIPAGTTATYAEIADRLGMPKGARAVAQACAANAVAIIVPCHRVVRSDGSLSGYRWGVERKRALLEREGAREP